MMFFGGWLLIVISALLFVEAVAEWDRERKRRKLQREIEAAYRRTQPPPLPDDDPLCVRHLIAGAHAEYPLRKK